MFYGTWHDELQRFIMEWLHLVWASAQEKAFLRKRHLSSALKDVFANQAGGGDTRSIADRGYACGRKELAKCRESGE